LPPSNPPLAAGSGPPTSPPSRRPEAQSPRSPPPRAALGPPAPVLAALAWRLTGAPDRATPTSAASRSGTVRARMPCWQRRPPATGGVGRPIAAEGRMSSALWQPLFDGVAAANGGELGEGDVVVGGEPFVFGVAAGLLARHDDPHAGCCEVLADADRLSA